MIYFRDVVTNEFFEVVVENEKQFQDDYEHPNRLVCVDVWYSDGSGFNGVKSSICYGTRYNTMMVEHFLNGTNNEVEYKAFLACCLKADPFDVIRTDSQLVWGQVTQGWNCNFENLIEMRDRAQVLVEAKKLLIQWIPREQNVAGQYLEANR